MATKKIRLPISIGVADEEKSRPERLTPEGRILSEAVTVTKIVPAGTLVTLDAAEADALLERYGPYKETVIVEEGEVADAPVPPAAQGTRARSV